jgi:hypothetical protein
MERDLKELLETAKNEADPLPINDGATFAQYTAPWGDVFPNVWIRIISTKLYSNSRIIFICSVFKNLAAYQANMPPITSSIDYNCNIEDEQTWQLYFAEGNMSYANSLTYLQTVVS